MSKQGQAVFIDVETIAEDPQKAFDAVSEGNTVYPHRTDGVAVLSLRKGKRGETCDKVMSMKRFVSLMEKQKDQPSLLTGAHELKLDDSELSRIIIEPVFPGMTEEGEIDCTVLDIPVTRFKSDAASFFWPELKKGRVSVNLTRYGDTVLRLEPYSAKHREAPSTGISSIYEAIIGKGMELFDDSDVLVVEDRAIELESPVPIAVVKSADFEATEVAEPEVIDEEEYADIIQIGDHRVKPESDDMPVFAEETPLSRAGGVIKVYVVHNAVPAEEGIPVFYNEDGQKAIVTAELSEDWREGRLRSGQRIWFPKRR